MMTASVDYNWTLHSYLQLQAAVMQCTTTSCSFNNYIIVFETTEFYIIVVPLLCSSTASHGLLVSNPVPDSLYIHCTHNMYVHPLARYLQEFLLNKLVIFIILCTIFFLLVVCIIINIKHSWSDYVVDHVFCNIL